MARINSRRGWDAIRSALNATQLANLMSDSGDLARRVIVLDSVAAFCS